MRKLWYKKSAKNWNEALPIGNGRLGAMFFGDPIFDRIQINEETLWSGYPGEDDTLYDSDFVNSVRELVKNKKYGEAQDTIKSLLHGKETAAYLSYGYFNIDIIEERSELTDYYRKLNLENAVAAAKFTLNGNKIEKSAFVSLADDVIVYRIKSERCISVRLTSGCELQHSISTKDGEIVTDGRCPTYVSVYDKRLEYDDDKESIPFRSVLKVIPISNNVKVYGGSSLRVSGTDFMLIFSLKTGFNGYDKQPISEAKEYKNACLECLSSACAFTYEELLIRHEAEYKKYFDRVSFTLEGEDFDEPTDERLKKAGDGRVDNKLITLLFDYSRFLAICSCGIGTQPTNLQGIWNEELAPLWRCNYTVNINTQMNYWTVNACDLPELHLPLFKMLRELKERGNHFGLRGWSLFHNTDIWRDNGIKSFYPSASWWVTGGAWLCRHIWEHYAHTRDLDFLKENYDVLVGQAEFLEDYMTEKDGELIISPSVSPENYFMFNGKKCGVSEWSAMDQEICIDFFDKMVKMTDALNKDSSHYKSILKKIKPTLIGSDGRLLEWNEELEEEDPGHRHTAHIYGFHPADVLTGEEYASAVRKSLEIRLQHNDKSFGQVGWACAWIACFYARLGDSEAFIEQVRRFIKGSLYNNMLSICTIFQIEANFGIASAIIEAIVQSHTGKIVTAPAIPKEWTHGEIKGIVVRTGEKIDFKW